MADLTALTDDGDTVDLEDGRTARLLISPDDINPFDEFDCYGKVSPIARRSMDQGLPRPPGFDGNAEKLYACGTDAFWWQPPADGPKRGTEEFAQERRLVIDLASWGMKRVALEILDGTDAYGRPIVVNVASLGGIDSLEDGYLAEVVSELAAELDIR
jgi:hypothetical protein